MRDNDTAFRVIEPDIPQSPRRTFALDVLESLSSRPRRLPPAYLYDEKGSELFRKISSLEEYYPARCEHEILSNHREAIADTLPREPFNLIELGAGDGQKTMLLIEQFVREGLRFEYMPLDISTTSVRNLTFALKERYSGAGLLVTGIVTEYFDGLRWLSRVSGARNLVLFLGSSIGNFDAGGSRRFLRHLWECLKPGDLVLIGFDLKKDISVLNRAYNDSEGLTKEFNLNLLDRINNELEGNFDRRKFFFHSGYDPRSGAVESYLVSTERQEVLIKGIAKAFSFDAWEALHTESSHKYLESEIECLAADTGFKVQRHFFDSRTYFADSLWSVQKPGLAGTGCCLPGQ